MSWALRDTWALAGRVFGHWRRSPAPLLISLLFPVLVVVMFTYLLGGQMRPPAGGAYIDFLVPGMLALTVLFGIESTMAAVSLDDQRGITDRLRTMPVASGTVLAARAVADLVQTTLGLAGLVVAGLLVGWDPAGGAGDWAAVLGLLLALRLALTWVGSYLALVAGDPQVVVAAQILVWPIGFCSSVFVDPATMPDWLGTVAQFNPVSATATAVRDLLGGPGFAGDAWAAANAPLLAAVWPVVLLAVFVPPAIRRYAGERP